MADLKRHAWDFAEEADAEVETVSVEEAMAELDEEGTLFVDIRDVRELWIEGSIPGAEHAPRGMIEWWADPETKYYRDYWQPDRRYVIFCNEAGRSALVARRLQEMGYEDVAHLEGGFTAWREADAPTEEVEQRDYSDR